MLPDLTSLSLHLHTVTQDVGVLKLSSSARHHVVMHKTVEEVMLRLKAELAETEEKFQKAQRDLAALITKRKQEPSDADQANKIKRVLSLGVAQARLEGVLNAQKQHLKEFADAYDAQCLWMRLARSPSRVTEGPTDSVIALSSSFTKRIDTIFANDTSGFLGEVKRVMGVTLQQANGVKKSELDQPMFSPLAPVYQGKASARQTRTKTLIDLLKTIVQREGGRAIYQIVAGQAKNALQLEHIVPTSWLRATESIAEFAYASHDFSLVHTTDASTNRSRSNKPLNFSIRESPEKSWPAQGMSTVWTDTERAFAARATVYALLMYPLLATDSQETKIAAAYNGAWESSAPNTVDLYQRQLEEILRLAQLPVQDWEYEWALETFMVTNRINPLTLSKRTRRAVADEAHPLGKLLRTRLHGQDALSTCLFHELFRHSEAHAATSR